MQATFRNHVRPVFTDSLHKKLNSAPSLHFTMETPSCVYKSRPRRISENHPSPPRNPVRSLNKILSEYRDYWRCCTDSSKMNSKVAYAFRIDSTIHSSYRLRKSFTVLLVELMAILLCLQHILLGSPHTNEFLILSDSLSSSHSILDPNSLNPRTQRILLILYTPTSPQKTMDFLWIP